jgi:hypothetical protein
MLPINSMNTFVNLANVATDYSAMALAFQRGFVSGQKYVSSLIATMIETRADEFMAFFSNPSTFLRPVDLIVDELKAIASYLPKHLKSEFWEYARESLKEQMTAFMQAQKFPAESIKRLCDHIDVLVDAQ